MSSPPQPLLKDLLRDVSRSFYLTLRILPRSIRDQIGLAYLLARTTDTIADTGAVPVEQRLTALRDLRSRVLQPGSGPITLPFLREHQSSVAERHLLGQVNEALNLLNTFTPPDRELIQAVLKTISDGQELDLLRFESGATNEVVALDTEADLDDYTYRVAGCVGEFWTRICLAHLTPKPRVSIEGMVRDGIRFGKGLQLVNILRDLPVDLRNGRCYLPWPALRLVGLRPDDLLNPANEPRLRPVYNEWLEIAGDHLDVAWRYVLNLPASWWRVRLACAWPVLIGLQTLQQLSSGNVLNPDSRVKVSRSDVKKIVRRSVLLYPFPALWNRMPERLRVRAG